MRSIQWHQPLATFLLTAILGYIVLVGGGVVGSSLYRWQEVNYGLGLAAAGLWFGVRGLWQQARSPRLGLEIGLISLGFACCLAWALSPAWRLGATRLVELLCWAIILYALVDCAAAYAWFRIGLGQALVIVTGLALMLAALEVYFHYVDRWSDLWLTAPYRVVSFLGHPNYLAGVVNLALPFTLLAWRQTTSVWARSGLLIWWLCYAVTFVFVSSRGGLLGIVVMIVVAGAWRWLALQPERRTWLLNQRSWLIVTGVLVISGALVTSGVLAWISAHGSHGGSGLESRLYIWGLAVNIMTDHPFVGIGPNQFGLINVAYRSVPPAYWPTHAHSIFWQTGAELGGVGWIALAVLLFNLFQIGRTVWGESLPTARWELAAGCIACLGYAAHNAVDDLTHLTAAIAPLLVVATLVLTARPVLRARWPVTFWIVPCLLALGLQGQWLWANAAFETARQAALAQDWQAAQRWAEVAQTRDPSFAFYSFEAGLFAARAEQWPAAITHFERATSIDPTLSTLTGNLALAREGNGDVTNASAAWELAARQAPDSVLIHLNAGRVAEALGQTERAQLHYAAVLRLQPDWVDRPFWRTSPVRQAAQAELTPSASSTPIAIEPISDEKLLALVKELSALGLSGESQNFGEVYGRWIYQRDPAPFDTAPGLYALWWPPALRPALAEWPQRCAWPLERLDPTLLETCQ